MRSSSLRSAARGFRTSAALHAGRPCTCGHSQSKPLCDGSHHNIAKKKKEAADAAAKAAAQPAAGAPLPDLPTEFVPKATER